jgi:hypothetical protein
MESLTTKTEGVVTLSSYIREVSGSNLGSVTGYPDLTVFCGFPRSILLDNLCSDVDLF